jgi:hypothetical protein
MWDWITDTFETVVDFVTGGGNDDDDPDPCDVGNCLDAQATLATARNDVRRACYFVKLTLVPIRAAIWALSRTLWEYILAAIIAVLLGPVGLIIAGFIIIGTLVTLRVGLPILAAFGRALGEAMQAEATAIAEVAAECPEDCQGNLDPSECDLSDGTMSVPSNPVTNWLGVNGVTNIFSGR